MIEEPTIVLALAELGYTNGFAASEADGIILWLHDTPEPTEAELIGSGWVKYQPGSSEVV